MNTCIVRKEDCYGIKICSLPFDSCIALVGCSIPDNTIETLPTEAPTTDTVAQTTISEFDVANAFSWKKITKITYFKGSEQIE